MLNLDGDFLPLHQLLADEQGIYVLLEDILFAREKDVNGWVCK